MKPDETVSLRASTFHGVLYRQEIAGGRTSVGGSRRGEGGDRQLEAELDLHNQAIAEIRAVLEFQVR
jgi:hypothetical protein